MSCLYTSGLHLIRNQFGNLFNLSCSGGNVYLEQLVSSYETEKWMIEKYGPTHLIYLKELVQKWIEEIQKCVKQERTRRDSLVITVGSQYLQGISTKPKSRCRNP